MKAKILRDTTIDGLAEKINREFEKLKSTIFTASMHAVQNGGSS